MDISEESIELIIAWEVGGGDPAVARSQYDRKYTHPHWPGNSASGLTIGIGYDLRWSRAWFEGDWKTRLDARSYERLARHLDRRGSREAERSTRDITIPWEDAMTVFRLRRLPFFVDQAKTVFPGVEQLGGDVWGALSSVVYNCGTNVEGPRRKLKAAAYASIRAAVAARDIPGVAAGIRALCAYHDLSPRVARGLKRRREDEARLVERAASRRSAA